VGASAAVPQRHNVQVMDLFQAFALLTSNGIGLLRLFAERSPYDVASYGIEISLAKNYAKLADVLSGPADSPRLQRESVALAEPLEPSLNSQFMITKHAKKLKARGAAWEERAELIVHEGTLDEVDAYGAQRVKDEARDTPKNPGVRIGRSV